ncbi:diphosphate--fructose-6-phosphate 1-phosphotransferase [Allofournierella massiliensis]|uniref:diphosphate--fructose-6-phosphate 1-phosphotransferase n=1 Tax=Allofournierella massiliensis TaxID=1650663 RepID=UPI0039A07E34
MGAGLSPAAAVPGACAGGAGGGPTAVINASLAGVFETARSSGAVRMLGMQHGIEGLLKGQVADLTRLFDSDLKIELLKRTPSSYLGGCRYKLPAPVVGDEVYETLFELFARYQVDAVLYIGGNDSMDTIAKLSTYGEAIGSPIRFVGVPKTIDNDLVCTDHTPGFGSAAKYIATIMKEVIRDSNAYDLRSVTVAEIMGRHAGWLAGAASLAKGDDCDGPDLILMPEVPFDPKLFLRRVDRLQKQKENVIIAASEGVKDREGRFLCDLAGDGGTRWMPLATRPCSRAPAGIWRGSSRASWAARAAPSSSPPCSDAAFGSCFSGSALEACGCPVPGPVSAAGISGFFIFLSSAMYKVPPVFGDKKWA